MLLAFTITLPLLPFWRQQLFCLAPQRVQLPALGTIKHTPLALLPLALYSRAT